RRVRVFFDGVPLVDGNDQAGAGFVGVTADGGVERRRAFDRIDQQDGNVGLFKVSAGHNYRNLFGDQLGLAFAANARRVHQAEVRVFEFKVGVNCVARRAGNGRNDDALGAGQAIDQRRLADVRTTDDGDADFALRRFADFG